MADNGDPGTGGTGSGSRSAAGAVSDVATSSDAAESVSIAMLVTFLALLWAGKWFGKARDWTHAAVGK